MEEEERPSSSVSMEPLLLLINAPSKNILLHLLDDVWRSRKQGLTPLAKASLRQHLRISADSEVDALVASILELLRKLVYTPLSEEEIQSMFPRDFHPQLGRLLVQLLSKGQHIWREEAIQSQVRSLFASPYPASEPCQ
ncbi:hypothetical protein O6H91_21G033900 [Diphasiastrum complanatum]|uniref:Uncharacterized protein n=1 Tax=Diphasiastrum complanatum TaxID=34168 RepID=A0ACC2AJF8_DIPCM|nr:hypothetical protein O6H91_21G033900 [Diphasiastrum complanatum]